MTMDEEAAGSGLSSALTSPLISPRLNRAQVLERSSCSPPVCPTPLTHARSLSSLRNTKTSATSLSMLFIPLLSLLLLSCFAILSLFSLHQIPSWLTLLSQEKSENEKTAYFRLSRENWGQNKAESWRESRYKVDGEEWRRKFSVLEDEVRSQREGGVRGILRMPDGRVGEGDLPPVRFFALGDWGRNGTFNQSLIARQMGVLGTQQQPQFVLSTGDNFYEDGLSSVYSEEFEASFSSIYTAPSLQVPWHAVLGNHDYYGDVLAQLDPLLKRKDGRWNCKRSGTFSHPVHSLSSTSSLSTALSSGLSSSSSSSSEPHVSSKIVDFFLFDTSPFVRRYRHSYSNRRNRHLDWRGINTSDWPAQERSQLQELEGWLSASTARWRIVVGHHPLYSFGKHGNQQELVENLKPLLEKYGVDVYMCGHDHNIQHIKRDDSPVHYFVNGAGSKAYKALHPKGDVSSLKYFWVGQAFASVSADVHSLTFDFIGAEGNTLYSYTLRKQSQDGPRTGRQ